MGDPVAAGLSTWEHSWAYLVSSYRCSYDRREFSRLKYLTSFLKGLDSYMLPRMREKWLSWQKTPVSEVITTMIRDEEISHWSKMQPQSGISESLISIWLRLISQCSRYLILSGKWFDLVLLHEELKWDDMKKENMVKNK